MSIHLYNNDHGHNISQQLNSGDFLLVDRDRLTLVAILRVKPEKLEVYFASWEAKWNLSKKDINNPKIAASHILLQGELVYPKQGKIDTIREELKAILKKRNLALSIKKKAKKASVK